MVLISKSIYNLKANGRSLVEVYKTLCMHEDVISVQSKQTQSRKDVWAFDKFIDEAKVET